MEEKVFDRKYELRCPKCNGSLKYLDKEKKLYGKKEYLVITRKCLACGCKIKYLYDWSFKLNFAIIKK